MPPASRPEVVELLRDLATRAMLGSLGIDEAETWRTRHRWSTAEERGEAIGVVLDETRAAIAMYYAGADQQDARAAEALADVGMAPRFDEQQWLDAIGVSPENCRGGDA